MENQIFWLEILSWVEHITATEIMASELNNNAA